MERNSPEEDRLQTKNIQLSEAKQTDKIEGLKGRPKQKLNDKVKKKRHLLSFDDDLQEKGQENNQLKIAKNPSVEIDKQHQLIKVHNGSLKEMMEEKFKEEYSRQTENIKEDLFEIQYSYWDGGSIVKKLRRKKKETIRDLLEICRLELIQNFQELAKISPDDLLFIIKDFIAPNNMAIYEIEALELKTTKDDHLLNFKNVKIKKEGKEVTLSVNFGGTVRIIEKIKFEKNKTMYPFCNWQTIDINR